MRHFARLLTAVLCSLLFLAPGAPLTQTAHASDGRGAELLENRLVVQFDDGTDSREMAAAHKRAGVTVVAMVPELNTYVVELSGGSKWLSSALYKLDSHVAGVEDDPIACTTEEPNDLYYNNTQEWGLFNIDAQGAWEVTHSNPDIRIAVLDTGIQSTHPDLADKIVAAADFTGSGTPEPVSNTHGTHVAGIAAASTNNAIGVASIGYNASLMNAKVMNESGTGYYSWIAAGVIWATDNGADVINMSLAGTSNSSLLANAIDYAWEHGVVVVAAAGNDSSTTPYYPAADPDCISVAASNRTNVLESWSNHGSWVDVSAPSSAYSTRINSSYTAMQGTSMASPYVAGLAALVLDVVSDTNGNGRTNDEARTAIESTSVDFGTDVKYGRIDAAAAVAAPTPPSEGEVSGTVLEAATSNPLEGVSVTDGTRSTTTDSQGFYFLSSVPPGTYTIAASADNYVPASQDITVVAGETATTDFSLEPVPAPNQAPVLDAIGSLSVEEKESLEFSVTASDPDDDALSYSIDGLPEGATFVDPVFSWTPAVGQAGSYNVTFTVSDGALTDEETVTINVEQIPPYGTVTGTVTDIVSGEPIAGALVSNGETSAITGVQGTYTMTSVFASEWTFTARADRHVDAAKDATVVAGDTTTVDFTLEPIPNTPPVLEYIGDRIVAEEEMLSFTVSGSDAEGDSLSYTTSVLPDGAWFQDRRFSWTPSLDQSGIYSITFTVSDGVLSDSETIAIDVLDVQKCGSIGGTVSDASSGTPIAGATVSAAGTSTITSASGTYTLADISQGVCFVDVSATGYVSSSRDVTVTADKVSSADFTLDLLPKNAPVLVTIGDRTVEETQTLEITLSGTDADGDSLTYLAGQLPKGASFAGQAFSWTPVEGQAGTWEVTFTVTDGTLSASETVTITVTPVQQTPDGAMWTESIDFYAIGTPTPTMLRVIVSVVNPDPLKDALVFVDIADSSGAVRHLYTRTDSLGQANYLLRNPAPITYTVTVSRVLHADYTWYTWSEALGVTEKSFLVGEPPAYGRVQGQVTSAADGQPIVNATVTDGTRTSTTDSMGMYALNDVPAGDNCIVSASADGYVTNSCEVSVLADSTTTHNITLQPVPNTAPSLNAVGSKAVDEGETLQFSVSATDPDNDPLFFSATGLPDGAAFAGQTFSWTPAVGDAGMYEVTFEVSDGELSDAETIHITVNAVPQFGTVWGTISDINTGAPVEGANVCVGSVSDTTGANGDYELRGIPAGAWSVSTSADGYYEVSRTITVAGNDRISVDLHLEPLPNDPPVLELIGDKDVVEEEALEFTVSAFDANDDALSYDAEGLPQGASFEGQTFSWTPNAGQAGSYDVTFTVSDGEDCDTKTITITVNEAQEAPADGMWVESINFYALGDPTSMLRIVVSVATPEPLADALVFIDITTPSGKTSHLYTRTDSLGQANYLLRSPARGEYRATVTRIMCGDYTWDTTRGTVSQNFTLP